MELYGANYGDENYSFEFVETKIHPALDQLEKIVCAKRDTELLDCFLEMLLDTQGSADETPSDILAAVFICQTDVVEARLAAIGTEDYLIGVLEFGFENTTYNREDEFENYKDLRNRIDKLLK